MKLKKMLSILAISACVLAVSQSAFADSALTSPETAGEITPTVVGVGDTKETAISLFHGAVYNLYLENAADEDWFKWTNDTGQPKKIHSAVYNINGNSNILVQGAFYDYGPGKAPSGMIYADPTPKGNSGMPSAFTLLYVPEGATIYFKVKAKEFYKLESYNLRFFVVDLD